MYFLIFFFRDSNLFEPAALPWPLGTDLEGDTLTVNQRNILKWEKDEPLGTSPFWFQVIFPSQMIAKSLYRKELCTFFTKRFK